MSRKLTQEEVIKQFNEVHGDKYDYSKMQYVDNATKVCIICPEPGHGEFWQSPNHHKSGRGCPKCGKAASAAAQRLTQEKVIEQFNKTHPDKYDYSKMIYVDASTKVCIICPEPGHGEFWQSPSHHKSGRGCSDCANAACAAAQRMSKEEVIKQFNEAHPDKYDYSKVEYVDARTQVCIICPEPGHGEFWQTPDNHKRGQGCPECAWDVRKHKMTKSQEQFILDCKKVHGDKYNYDKAIYKKDKLPVTITCPEHGDFEQRANSHLRGQGCPYCGNNSIAENTTREVLEGLLKTALPTTRKLDCLKSPQTGHRLELDGYCEKNKIAFEFQGVQHYEPVPLYGGEEGLRVRQKRDAIKRSACIANGICLIEIDGRKIPRSVRATGEKLKPYILEQLLDQPEWKKKRLMPLLENNHSL